MPKTTPIRLLEQAQISYDTIEYEYDEQDLSLDNIAAANGLDIERIYKTLVCLSSSKEVIVAVVAGHHSLSSKKLAQLIQEKKVDLAPIEQLQSLTGYIRGGCSPLGMKKPFRVFIDQTAQTIDWVYVNAGKRGLLFGCPPEELRKACNGEFADIAS